MTEQLPDPNNQQPAPGQYTQPPQQPQQQQNQQQYAQPQQPAPGAAYQQPQQSTAEQIANTVNLNYWLSVFFVWLPALIFYFTEKGKSPLSDQYHRENLNFSLLRTIAIIAASFIIWIPILGQIVWLVAWLGGFILHLLVAIKAKERFEKAEAPGFLFNMPMVK